MTLTQAKPDVQEALRDAMSHVASPVSVVTTVTDGTPHGSTVGAFMSLSMDPPMVLVSLDRTSTLLSRLHVGSPLGLNVLSADQQHVAAQFATKGEDKFRGIGWRTENGAPALIERHAWVAGTVDSLVEAGDHVVVFVDVLHAEVGTGSPLTYWRRSFGTHSATR